MFGVKGAFSSPSTLSETYLKGRWWLQQRRTTFLRSAFLLIIVGLLYLYWLVVTDWGHGTFLPPFVQMSTSNFDANIPSQIPQNWRPPFRIVVSLTSMPHHLEWLPETLDSLYSQSLTPDAIYLNIPNGAARTGDEYYVPQYLLDDYNAHIFTDISAATATETATSNSDLSLQLRIVRTDDFGPLTKLVPALLLENDPSTLIITVDDDQIYPSKLVQTLAWHSYNSGDNAWGDCGWGFLKVPHRMEITRVYVPWIFRGSGGRRVEVIEGICGNAYRRSFFGDVHKLYQSQPKECFTTDDLWISAYLQFNGPQPIPRVIMQTDVSPEKTNWKKTKEDWSKTLYNQNIGNVDKRINCIRAIENLFQSVWVA